MTAMPDPTANLTARCIAHNIDRRFAGHAAARERGADVARLDLSEVNAYALRLAEAFVVVDTASLAEQAVALWRAGEHHTTNESAIRGLQPTEGHDGEF